MRLDLLALGIVGLALGAGLARFTGSGTPTADPSLEAPVLPEDCDARRAVFEAAIRTAERETHLYEFAARLAVGQRQLVEGKPQPWPETVDPRFAPAAFSAA